MTANSTRFFRPALLLMTGFVLCGLVAPVHAQKTERLAPAAPALTAPADPLVPTPAPLPEPDRLVTPAEPPAGTKTLDLGTEAKKVSPDESPDPADIPDILMQEMKEIEASCRANYFYSSFHDCRCVAVKFLDARIRNDPGMSRDLIFQSVASECPDEVSIAGFTYRSCYDFMKFHRPYDYREFCACSARKIAENYKEKPIINLSYIERLRKDAYYACGLADAPEWRTAPNP